MTYNLAEMMLRQRRNYRDGVTLQAIEPTATLQNELTAIMMPVVNYWQAEALENLVPVYTAALEAALIVSDNDADRINFTISSIADGASRLALALGTRVNQFGIRVERWHTGRWRSTVRRSTGLDVSPLIRSMRAEAEVEAFLNWSSDLIRNISDETRRRIEADTFRLFASRARPGELAKAIRETASIGRARAKFIGADQTNKLSGKLDELRQREAGITQYRWETAKDSRVRQTHRELQGKVFGWTKPPPIGHPRTEPRCRCSAQPWIPLLEEIEA